MSKVQLLRALVKQRLAAAVEDIFGLFERTIAEYEEELSRTRDENERQQKFLDAALQPQIQIYTADVQQLLGREEEVPVGQPGQNSSLDQEDPEPPHIKEEQQELWSSQQGEQLQGLEKADITKLLFTPVPVKSEDDDGDEAQSSAAACSSTERMESESEEDCGGPGSAGNSDPDNMTDESSDTEVSDDWQDTRDLESALRTNGVPRGRTGDKLFSCPECEKCFTDRRNLKIHMKIHTGEKPHSCSFCKKSFTQSGTLKNHILTHTGEKPYSCSVCRKSFTWSGSLRNHMLTHTGEKPHTCSVCKRSFALSGNLRSHMLTHTGEKPYSCSLCEKSFTQSSNLKKHMWTHKGKKPHSCSRSIKSLRANRVLEKHM